MLYNCCGKLHHGCQGWLPSSFLENLRLGKTRREAHTLQGEWKGLKGSMQVKASSSVDVRERHLPQDKSSRTFSNLVNCLENKPPGSSVLIGLRASENLAGGVGSLVSLV